VKTTTIEKFELLLVNALLMLAMPLVILHGWTLFVHPWFGLATPSYLGIMGITATLRLSAGVLRSTNPRDVMSQLTHEQRMEDSDAYRRAVNAGLLTEAIVKLTAIGILALFMSLIARFQ